MDRKAKIYSIGDILMAIHEYENNYGVTVDISRPEGQFLWK